MNRGKTSYLHKFNFGDLGLDAGQVEEVLDLSPGSSNDPIPEMIREALKAAGKKCSIEGGYVIYDNPKFDLEQMQLHAGGVPLSIGNIILPQILRSSRLAVFVCTAGHEIGKYHEKEMNEGNFLYSSILEGVTTLVVERAIDKVQDHLVKSFTDKESRITNRFSPGFCNWDASEQKKLFSLLPPGFSKVKLNHRNELDPVKSIAGIIGIGREVKANDEKCKQCTTPRCKIRKS